MNEQVLKTISAFQELPETAEKEEIKRKYLGDEIGAFDFYSLASEYLDKVEKS